MMVDTQIRPSDVTKFPIIDAMLAVPREIFVPAQLREAAYVGENVELGGGRVVLEPRTLAKMLDALDIHADDLVLDIGCALGYSAAVMARLPRPSSRSKKLKRWRARPRACSQIAVRTMWCFHQGAAG